MTTRLMVLNLFICLTALRCGAAAAAPVSELESLFVAERYEEFFASAKPAAGQGDAEALFLLGKACHLGKGTKRDTYCATSYYQAAIARGSSRAAHNLGLIKLDEGDNHAAAKYLEQAIAGGIDLPFAYYALAQAYDRSRAEVSILDGPDLSQATHHYLQAYEKGYGDVALHAAIRAAVAAFAVEPNAQARATYRARAVELAGRGAALGWPDAMQDLGAVYYYERDYAGALPWFEKAAKLDQPVAIYSLGLMYRDGLGVEPDRRRAWEFFDRASGLGNRNATGDAIELLDDGIPESAATIGGVERRIAALEDYGKRHDGEFAFSVGYRLARLQQKLDGLRIVKANAEIIQPVPAGTIFPVICLGDSQENTMGLTPSSFPYAYTSWAIYDVDRDMVVHPKPIVAGKTGQNGCIRLSSDYSDRFRVALKTGRTLRLHYPGQAWLLRLVPNPKTRRHALVLGKHVL